MRDISRGKTEVRGFDDAEMDFQLIRQMGASYARAASVGECLHIARKIHSANPKEWVDVFEQQALWQKEDGLNRLKKNHVISGQEQLFKASNHFRAAEYFSPVLSERHRKLGQNSIDCFTTAMGCMDVHFETHAIPFKNIQLPTYFISPSNDGQPRKTLMIVSGFDGTMEESFFMNGLAAIERNYNVILFAGPGQMDIFRYFPETYFEPEFEQVVTSVVDFFSSREELDLSKLALLGISLGGYFATRAASYEPRIKALIANSPILDLHAYLSAFAGMSPDGITDVEDFTVKDLQFISESEMSEELKTRTEQLLVRFGQRSFKETFVYLKQFAVGDGIGNIQCPALGLVGESEGREPYSQYQIFCETLKADGYQFSDVEGAGMHCQTGNLSFSNAVIFDWLDSL